MNSFDKEIAKALEATGFISSEEVLKLLTVPQDTTHGNFTMPCFVLAKTLRKAPKIIAEELAEKIQLPFGLSKVEAVNGYLNFFIDREFLSRSVLSEIESKGLSYGHKESNGKTVCIDYSSPNIGKELAFHHLRSTMIGNSLSRIYKANGYCVERINHLGDWGTQFGKMLCAYKAWGKKEDVEEKGVNALIELYVRFEKEADEKMQVKFRVNPPLFLPF